MYTKKFIFLIAFLTLLLLPAAKEALAYQIDVAYLQKGSIQIHYPQTLQFFYDQLQGKPRDYTISSDTDFTLDAALLVPAQANGAGRYSADVFSVSNGVKKEVANLDGTTSTWTQIYDADSRDYYLQGPKTSQTLSAGNYIIEVSSKDNQGKYILKIGTENTYQVLPLLNLYWQLPLLKINFLDTSVLQFFLTPFAVAGIGALGALLIIIALLYYLAGLIGESIKHNQAKTLLLTSNGMQMKQEIVTLLQKPAYDVTVAFITTAAKPLENIQYLRNDWNIMRDELGFNVEEIDIEGKKESQVMKLLQLKDIIFVEGGNTFYLLKAMRACNFEKIIRKLLKEGRVYIGASAGSVVAGRTIKTAGWQNGDKNIVKLKNLKGLNLVPFDLFVHYQTEDEVIIKNQVKSKRKRKKKLRILTDAQALLVQGKEIDLIGQGEQIIV